MFKPSITFLFAALVVLSGCDNNPKQHSNALTQSDYTFATDKSSWLRYHLPAQTVAYANIPNLWNLLFDPKADSLHPIQQKPVFQKQVTEIKNAAAKKYLTFLPKDKEPLIKMLLQHHSGPIELALINYSKASLMPNLAVATTLQNFSAEQLDALISNTLQQLAPQINSEKRRSNDLTQWQFQMQGVTNHIHYKEQTGQLLVLSGLGANEQKLLDIWQSQTDASLTKITALDQQEDPSGLNLKAWVAASKLYQLGAAFIPERQRQSIEQLGLNKMEYLWLGTASAAGKSALSLHLLMPETGWRLLLPRSSNHFDVSMAGKPESVLQIALPTIEQVKSAVSMFPISEKDKSEWSEGRNKFKAMVGFDPADLLQAYEQNLLMINDESGRWFALKVKDQAKHQNIVDQFNKLVKTSATTQKLAGVEINQMHYSSMQQLFLLTEEADQPKNFEQISQFMGLFKQHSYWVREGDVIYFAAVPQILAEKFNSNNSQRLSEWLHNQQQVNWDSAIFAYGKEIKNLPKDIYHIYLSAIQVLGDLAGTHVDLFQLPTASELQLPESGRMNLALSSDSEKVSLTLAYEYSILESLLSGEGSMMSLYTAAILMSYALPAYRDYTVRAKIGGALAQASGLKLAVSEHAINTGSLQGIDTASLPQIEGITVDQESGTIVIQLQHWEPELAANKQVYLIPQMSEQGYIQWRCESNIGNRFLPSMCRGNY